MNAPRLGLFEPIQKLYGATDSTHWSFPIRNVAAAATSGASCVYVPLYSCDGSAAYRMRTH